MVSKDATMQHDATWVSIVTSMGVARVLFHRLSEVMLGLSLTMAFASAQSAPPLSLKQVYEEALSRTQSLAIQASRAEQADERVHQVSGSIFPKLSLIGGYSAIDRGSAGSLGPSVYSARVNLSQSLFKGPGDFAALRSVENDASSKAASTQNLRVSLYASVGQVYYDVLSAEHDLTNLRASLDLIEDRIKDLTSRAKIGRTRKSEVLASRSQALSLKALIQGATSKLKQTRDTFALTTGLSADTLLKEPQPDVPAKLGTVEEFLKLVENRPDLAAMKFDVAAADELVSVARAGHFPALSFDSNYYFTRSGTLSGSAWDIGGTLTVPLYSGGAVSALVRERSARQKELELTLALARRVAERDIRVAHEGVASGTRQLAALKESLEAAQQVYQEQKRDYRYGLSTNLDVIQALNAMQDTKRELDKTYFYTLASWSLLQAAVGNLPL